MDIMNQKATDKDRERENCKFVVVRINGWPRVFVITTKKISKNKELLMDYGEGYTQFFNDKARYQRIMNYRKCIADNIKSKTIDNLPLNGPYQLE